MPRSAKVGAQLSFPGGPCNDRLAPFTACCRRERLQRGQLPLWAQHDLAGSQFSKRQAAGTRVHFAAPTA